MCFLFFAVFCLLLAEYVFVLCWFSVVSGCLHRHCRRFFGCWALYFRQNRNTLPAQCRYNCNTYSELIEVSDFQRYTIFLNGELNNVSTYLSYRTFVSWLLVFFGLHVSRVSRGFLASCFLGSTDHAYRTDYWLFFLAPRITRIARISGFLFFGLRGSRIIVSRGEMGGGRAGIRTVGGMVLVGIF